MDICIYSALPRWWLHHYCFRLYLRECRVRDRPLRYVCPSPCPLPPFFPVEPTSTYILFFSGYTGLQPLTWIIITDMTPQTAGDRLQPHLPSLRRQCVRWSEHHHERLTEERVAVGMYVSLVPSLSPFTPSSPLLLALLHFLTLSRSFRFFHLVSFLPLQLLPSLYRFLRLISFIFLSLFSLYH